MLNHETHWNGRCQWGPLVVLVLLFVTLCVKKVLASCVAKTMLSNQAESVDSYMIEALLDAH